MKTLTPVLVYFVVVVWLLHFFSFQFNFLWFVVSSIQIPKVMNCNRANSYIWNVAQPCKTCFSNQQDVQTSLVGCSGFAAGNCSPSSGIVMCIEWHNRKSQSQLIKRWNEQQHTNIQNQRRRGFRLTCHWVRTGHEVEGGGVRGIVWGAGLRDLVEAVGGGGHVFIHAVEAGVQSGSVRVPELQAAASGAIAVFPAPVHWLRVTGQGGWEKRQDEDKKLSRLCSLQITSAGFSCKVATRKFSLRTAE